MIDGGRLFHSLEAATVKVLSPAWVRVRGYLSWRLSLEDLRFKFDVQCIHTDNHLGGRLFSDLYFEDYFE